MKRRVIISRLAFIQQFKISDFVIKHKRLKEAPKQIIWYNVITKSSLRKALTCYSRLIPCKPRGLKMPTGFLVIVSYLVFRDFGYMKVYCIGFVCIKDGWELQLGGWLYLLILGIFLPQLVVIFRSILCI